MPVSAGRKERQTHEDHTNTASTGICAVGTLPHHYGRRRGARRLQRDPLPSLAAIPAFLARLPPVSYCLARANPSPPGASFLSSSCPGVLRGQLHLAHVASPCKQWSAQTLAVPRIAHPVRRPGGPRTRALPALWQFLSLALHRGQRHSRGNAPDAQRVRSCRDLHTPPARDQCGREWTGCRSSRSCCWCGGSAWI